ncbi:MAG TPA: hybrid sensor histidine kinase/response regulator [Caldilineaceae bacterium]|nr:hybrid sensor histidine kinase/response regulator [Caldilineaceae bacterium]
MSEQNKPRATVITERSPVPLPRSQGATILVVEDNLMLNRSLCELLRAHGYQVLTACNGLEALDLLRSKPVNLVLSDVVMPDLDGYGLLRQIRGDPQLFPLPVVFLTGYATPSDRLKAKEHGVEDYLVKPPDYGELLATIQNVLSRRMMIEESYQRQVEEVRNQILGLVQHEFRTPLTFVMGYAEFLHSALNEEIERAELQHSVEAILEGSRRLHHLIENFLTLAGLNERTLDPSELYPLDPIALWRESLIPLRGDVERARLRVVLEEPPDPVIAFGAFDLLREALVRLLDNAIRYRRLEPATIWLSTAVRPGYVGWLIRDQGPGIPADRLAELARPFNRLPRSPGGAHGAGLGLALAQRVAQLHGGFLSIESEEGVGSTFGLWVRDTEPE